jgi:D-alanine-D-alanine ligase
MPATAKLPVRSRARTLRIAVLMGGVSSEREVSLRSGKAVVQALAKLGHEALAVEIDSDGPDALRGLPPDVDAAFLALHGRFGEDGEVQTRLQVLGVPYTGSGPAASARAFDKAWTKEILRARGVPVAEDVVLGWPFRARDVAREVRRAASFAQDGLVVKPVREGSSVGVTIVKTVAQAMRAAWKARSFEQPLLVERFVKGRELTVAILGGVALPPIEVVPALAFYDYRAKYDPSSGTRYRVDPDDLPPGVRAAVERAALQAHEALGCEDVSRVDVRVSESGAPYVLEVNTIPGLTATSLLPKAAAAAGIGFEELCLRLVQRAIRRASAAEEREPGEIGGAGSFTGRDAS